MPALEYSLATLVNELRNSIQFTAAETSGALKTNGFQPELCHHGLASHVDVWGLASVLGHEEKPIAADSEDGRHFIATLSHQLRLA